MKKAAELELLLRQRPPGWWDVLLDAIPDLSPLADTPQPKEFHAEGDVAAHTRLAVESCPPGADPDLYWVALLHDIGKPGTTREADGRITAHGHAVLGAEIAAEILGRLGMTGERKARILWAIRHHGFHHSWNLKEPSNLTPRQRRFLRHPDFPLLLEFLGVDQSASRGHPEGRKPYRIFKKLFEDTTLP